MYIDVTQIVLYFPNDGIFILHVQTMMMMKMTAF